MHVTLCMIIWLITAVQFHSVISQFIPSLTSDSVSNDTLPLHENICGMSKGEWSYPAKCNGYGCDYRTTWEYMDDTDEIMFTVATKNRNKWTGIGFSTNQAMPETDAILGLVEESGRFFIMDTWLRAYEAPPLDQEQNIANMTAWRENGITTLRFFRKRLTGDSKDFQFTDTNCPYLVFPVMGGLFNAVNKRIRKHEATPIISDNKVCIRSCKPQTLPPQSPPIVTSTESPTTEAKMPVEIDSTGDGEESKKSSIVPTVSTSTLSYPMTTDYVDIDTRKFNITLEFPDLWKPLLAQRESNEYRSLTDDIHQQMHNELIKLYPSVKKLEVTQLNRVHDESYSMRAKIRVSVSDKNNNSVFEKAIDEMINDETIGNLKVDPTFKVIENDSGDSKKSTDLLGSYITKIEDIISNLNDEQIKWALIIIGISLLVMIALIQGCCMLRRQKKTKEKTPPKDKQSPNSHWKDYAAATASSAYSYENFGPNDDPEGAGKPNMPGNGHSSGKYAKQMPKQQYSKNFSDKMPSYQGYHSATIERNPQHKNYGYSNAYATHDRKEPYNRHHMHPSYSYPNLQPDFYFMPHQRRYSGEVVRVFVDYNNPQYVPK